MKLSQRIQKVRAETGLNLSQFAKLCAVSHTAISQLEAGTTKSIKFAICKRIEVISGFSAQWMSEGTGDERIASVAPTPVLSTDELREKLALLSRDDKTTLATMSLSDMQLQLAALSPARRQVIAALLREWQDAK